MSDNRTSLQRIVGSEERAREMLADLEELPSSDEDLWQLNLTFDADDLPHIIAELREMVPDDDGG